MQRGNGSPAACAACKHQRKRCDNNCAMAPYFPASKTREFQAVHKVYGMSNVIKILRSIEREEDRRKAADSLVWEAVCRQRDPVLGSYGEFKKVADELKILKNQNQQLQEAYARASELIGWSSSGNGMNTATGGGSGGCRNNGLNYVNNNGYPRQIQIQEEVMTERDVSGAVLVVPQQHPTNGFAQQYCFPGRSPSSFGNTEKSLNSFTDNTISQNCFLFKKNVFLGVVLCFL